MRAAQITENHRYFTSRWRRRKKIPSGDREFLQKKVQCHLDPNTEVLRSSFKEGIAHLSLLISTTTTLLSSRTPRIRAFHGVIMAGGILYSIPSFRRKLSAGLESIPKEVVKMAKLMFISYPHNPTGCVRHKIFRTRRQMAQGKNIIIAHDLTYSDIVYDVTSSELSSDEGCRDFGIEFHTLSNRTTCPAGASVTLSATRIFENARKTKSYLDFGYSAPFRKLPRRLKSAGLRRRHGQAL